MDKEQAKFILGSYRPGSDAVNDEDFAEALTIAADNRELGEWLAKERAMDDSFAKALAAVALPVSLREDILGCLHGERHDFPDAEGRQDAAMIGALASVQVPSKLRGDILAAMQRSAPNTTPQVTAIPQAGAGLVPFWKRFSIPLAAAAGIALALILTPGPGTPTLASNKRVPLEVVQAGFINTYESPSFALEVKQNNKDALVENLKSRSLPCPCCLPPGLEGAKSIGCRELTINGKHGSVICFEQKDIGVVHLVIFRRGDIDGQCKDLEAPCYDRKGPWSIARWQNTENVFILIGNAKVEQMKKLFEE